MATRKKRPTSKPVRGRKRQRPADEPDAPEALPDDPEALTPADPEDEVPENQEDGDIDPGEDTATVDPEIMKLERLDAFGQSLAVTRAEAVNARAASGIEDIWLEDEEFYNGIDDLNRGEEGARTRLWKSKPAGQAEAKELTTRSTVFPNITGPFVDSASARMSDMLLPVAGDKGWSIRPTPIPDLDAIAQGKFSSRLVGEINAAHPNDAQGQENAKAQAQAAEVQRIELAKERAERAEKQIHDWQIECAYHAQARMQIEDAVRCGAGVLKGPVPLRKKSPTYIKPDPAMNEKGGLRLKDRLIPGSKWVNFWNFYPDPACGENIHNGNYTWERDDITRKLLRDLKGQPGYIDEQIDKCIAEGPMRDIAEYSSDKPAQYEDEAGKKDQFSIWYFHGTAEKEQLEAAGVDTSDMQDPNVHVVVTMVNDRVIRATVNPLDTGEFPYDVMIWRRIPGHWAGEGIARLIRVPQRIVTAGTRNMMDNAGLAGGPMIVMRQGVVEPADKKYTIRPRKIWLIAEDADEMADATKAIGQIKVDIMVQEMKEIIMYGLQLAETMTSMPMILQGQMGQSVPETLGGQELFQRNASTVLRRQARLYDDRVQEPHLRRYYAWYEEYEAEEGERGDCCVDARGSSTLVEREIQNQALLQLGQLFLNPVFKKDPAKWANEYLLSLHFDPKKFDFDDEKWAAIIEQMAQGPQDMTMAVAQLNGEFKLKIQDAMNAFKQAENERERKLKIVLKGMDAELQTLLKDVERGMKTDDLKVRVADFMTRTNATLRLAGLKASADETPMKPPVEPPGTAKPGMSVTQ